MAKKKAKQAAIVVQAFRNSLRDLDVEPKRRHSHIIVQEAAQMPLNFANTQMDWARSSSPSKEAVNTPPDALAVAIPR